MRVIGSQIFDHDLKREGVFHVLISVVGWYVDGGKRFFSLGSLWRYKAREVPWPVARVSSSASYDAWNTIRFDPTRSRRQGDPALQTYGEGNGRGRAGDGGTVRSALGDGEDSLQQCSGFESSSTALPCSPQAPPWVNCLGRRWIELVRRLSLCAWVWGLRDKIQRIRATIYMATWSYS
jgi:hypothetical protein